MSEESRNPGMELNEAALSGVSGGNAESAAYVAKAKAKQLCETCHHMDHNAKTECKSAHMADLANYLLKNGTSSVPCVQQCPYF